MYGPFDRHIYIRRWPFVKVKLKVNHFILAYIFKMYVRFAYIFKLYVHFAYIFKLYVRFAYILTLIFRSLQSMLEL